MSFADKQAGELRDSINAIVANRELMETAHQEISKLLRVRFELLVAAGFTPEQALEIVKARGIMP